MKGPNDIRIIEKIGFGQRHECEEDKIEETVESMMCEEGVYIEEADEDEPQGNINSVYIYDITNKKKFSAVKIVKKLNADADEPLVPVEDRNVLVLGTEYLIWAEIMRNPEAAAMALAGFQSKLAMMAGRTEAATDRPLLSPS